ncbi:hypothetical protein SAMN02745945_01529 [Peptoclostridium litorale DSM 5388]|uniref:Anti-sigma factor RsgI-like middle domain-containing protein n=1 Tax=Peptoclostridium litorale DSM 5388 TaxID=1121324 RepID=A0A069RFW3_PEPLI|nr:hypothetical protein [Peptoclostridium litorale]KDR95678.1 hypothetical protein CLIT_10c04050 [Peptoclostridium litorale DSM 5388]SIO00896.1 hypothetical protein SAMN02745945_01529 [Peptoclostridium litorale DSM 5388]
MVYKGKVLKVEKDHVMVVTEDMMYLKLHPRKCKQGKSIMFVEDDILNEKNMTIHKSRLMAAAIAILILSVSIISGVAVWDNYSYAAIVGLDINPGIEFMVDENDIVKRVRPTSEYGNEIIRSEMKGMKIEEAIPVALDIAAKKDYITMDTEKIVVSRVEKDGTAGNVDEIIKSIEEWTSENEILKGKDAIYIQQGVEKHNKSNGKDSKTAGSENESADDSLKQENKTEQKQESKGEMQSTGEAKEQKKESAPAKNKEINKNNKPGGNEPKNENIDKNAAKKNTEKTKEEKLENSESQALQNRADKSFNGSEEDSKMNIKEATEKEKEKKESSNSKTKNK